LFRWIRKKPAKEKEHFAFSSDIPEFRTPMPFHLPFSPKGCWQRAQHGIGQNAKIMAQMIRISKSDYQRNLHFLKYICQVAQERCIKEAQQNFLGGIHANKLVKFILLAED
jgi:hypothetical protein